MENEKMQLAVENEVLLRDCENLARTLEECAEEIEDLSKKNERLKTLCYNTLVLLENYVATDDSQDYITILQNDLGMTEEEYKDIMGGE